MIGAKVEVGTGESIDDILDEIAHAMGLWAFPDQDDLDFAWPP